MKKACTQFVVLQINMHTKCFQYFTTAATESLSSWMPDDTDLLKGPSAPAEPICFSSSLPLLYLFNPPPPLFSSDLTPLLLAKVQLLGNSGELCLCSHEAGKCESVKERSRKEKKNTLFGFDHRSHINLY